MHLFSVSFIFIKHLTAFKKLYKNPDTRVHSAWHFLWKGVFPQIHHNSRHRWLVHQFRLACPCLRSLRYDLALLPRWTMGLLSTGSGTFLYLALDQTPSTLMCFSVVPLTWCGVSTFDHICPFIGRIQWYYTITGQHPVSVWIRLAEEIEHKSKGDWVEMFS